MDENRITELWNKAVAEIGDCTYPQIITRFAELVAADECEACAAAIRAAALESDDEAEAYGMQMAAGLLDKRSNVELRGGPAVSSPERPA